MSPFFWVMTPCLQDQKETPGSLKLHTSRSADHLMNSKLYGYLVGSLDLNFWGNSGFSIEPTKNHIFAEGSTATKVIAKVITGATGLVVSWLTAMVTTHILME